MSKRAAVQSFLAFLLAVALVLSLTATAVATRNLDPLAQAVGSQAQTLDLVAGNYCVSCHMPGDERLESVTGWRGGVQQLEASACPAANRITEEIYYTERLLLAIDRAQGELAGNPALEKINSRLATSLESYQHLLDSPVQSLDAFITQAQLLRYRLNKTYTALNDLRDATRQRNILIIGLAVTLAVLASLVWGLRNSAKFSGKFSPDLQRLLRWPGGIALLLIVGLFALPIFRVFSAPVAATTIEEQEQQASLDAAERAATAADQAAARAWMLARVGAAWQATQPQSAEVAFEAALSGIQELQARDTALWGEAQLAREATVGTLGKFELAGITAAQLDSARSRAWGLRLMAFDWIAIDAAKASSLLDQALAVALKGQGTYRDLDLRGIAVTWSYLDIQKALEVIEQVNDPALRAWGLREIGALAGNAGTQVQVEILRQAGQAARQVQDPAQQAQALLEIGVALPEFFDEAATVIATAPTPAQAILWSELALWTGDASLVEKIGPDYAGVRALALINLKKYEDAWQLAAQIEDPYIRAHLHALIAVNGGSAEAARQIEIPWLRDRALRDVTRISGDLTLAEEIVSAYARMQALVHLRQFDAAAQLVDSLKDPYPLLDLGKALARENSQAALVLVDKLGNEADKADLLIAIAENDPSVFERALGMALAARVRGDPLAPARASLTLAQIMADVDPALAQKAYQQAYEAALRIAIK